MVARAAANICLIFLFTAIATSTAGTGSSGKNQFNINEWFQRIAEVRAKFEEKCLAGCVFNYNLVWGIWEAFQEPVEGLIQISGISVDIYPGLRDKILESCVDKTVNYCDPVELRKLIGCSMPFAKPYIGEIIKIAKENFIAVEAAWSEFAPRLMAMLENLKCGEEGEADATTPSPAR